MTDLPCRNVRRVALLAVFGLSAGCASEPSGPQPPDAETIAKLTITQVPSAPSQSITAGYTPLNLDSPRDGFLYVPVTYNPDVEAPLLVLLHGGDASSEQWTTEDIELLAESYGVVVLATDSRYETWDVASVGRYDVDVEFLRRALAFTFDRVLVNPALLAIGGFSDGAAEAIGIGLANAHLFKHVIAFSPGILETPFKRGDIRIFLSHGHQDAVAPFAYTRDWIVPKLRQNGQTVEFVEFEGDHSMPSDIQASAFAWLFDEG